METSGIERKKEMYCQNCGKEIGEARGFCPECGKKIQTGEAGVWGGAAEAKGSVPNPNEVLYEKKLCSNVSNPLTMASGKFTLTNSEIAFKSYMLGGNFKISYSEVAAVNRTTYGLVNPNALEIRTKSGKKYVILLGSIGAKGKAEVDRAMEVIRRRI